MIHTYQKEKERATTTSGKRSQGKTRRDDRVSQSVNRCVCVRDNLR